MNEFGLLPFAPVAGTFERLRSSRLFRVVSVYIIASWAVLQAIDLLTAQFGLPGWFFHAGLGLLLVGLPIIIGAAVIQARMAAKGGEPSGIPQDRHERSARGRTTSDLVGGYHSAGESDLPPPTEVCEASPVLGCSRRPHTTYK